MINVPIFRKGVAFLGDFKVVRVLFSVLSWLISSGVQMEVLEANSFLTSLKCLSNIPFPSVDVTTRDRGAR